MNNDLISRKALKKVMGDLYGLPFEEMVEDFTWLKAIDTAQTAEALKDITEIHCDITEEQLLNALRPKGEWIDVPCERDLLFNTGIKYTCSVCGKFNSNGHSSFCPDCGADMRGAKECNDAN